MKNYILEHFDEALKNKWIEVYYQPVVRTITGAFCGAEALARWNDPGKGLLPPAKFIPVLEETGRITELDLYVLKQICQDYQMISQRGYRVVPVSFNLSRKDLLHDDIIERIEAIMARYNVPRELINVEITESAFVEDVERIGPALKKLHELGYQVWMDDFGSGYSSLGILKDYSFDEIKIDMSFLSNFDKKARNIIRSVVTMAKRIGVQTLAEGVGTKEQYVFLYKIGCEKIQGYYFGRPMPGKVLHRYVKDTQQMVESLAMQNYYNQISAVNYQTDAPLMIIERYDKKFHILYSNEKYTDVLHRDGIASTKQWEAILNDPKDPMNHFHNMFVEHKLQQMGEEQIITYPRGDHYMELKGKAIASFEGHMAYQAELRYVAIHVRPSENDQLDEYLRDTYYMYSDMALLDLDKDEVVSIKSSIAEQPIGRHKVIYGAQHVMDTYRNQFVYPADQKSYEAFYRISTMEQRLRQSKTGIISGYFSHKKKGGYQWGHNIAMAMPQSDFRGVLLMVINSGFDSEELLGILSRRKNWMHQGEIAALKEKDSTADLLWTNMCMHSPIMCFWKDKNRRFAGASRSFLKYYGLSSVDELVGKTDEDMHWHIENGPFHEDEVEALTQGKSVIGARGNCIVQGKLHHILASKMPVYEDGTIVGLLGFFVDLDQQLEDEKQYARNQLEDPVTGLNNLRGLAENMNHYLEEFWHHGVEFCIMGFYIKEYERFRRIYGDTAGDAYLKAIGQALQNVFDHRAILAYVINGQFYVIMQYENPADMQQIQQEAVQHIESIHHVGEWRCTCTAETTLSFVNEENAGEIRYEQLMYQFMQDLGKDKIKQKKE